MLVWRWSFKESARWPRALFPAAQKFDESSSMITSKKPNGDSIGAVITSVSLRAGTRFPTPQFRKGLI